MALNLNQWELSLPIWSGGSLASSLYGDQNYFMIPATVLDKLMFPQQSRAVFLREVDFRHVQIAPEPELVRTKCSKLGRR